MALCVSMDESTICILLVLDPSYWSTVSLDILVLFFLRAQASRSHSSFSLCLLYLPPTFFCRMTFKILKPWQGGVWATSGQGAPGLIGYVQHFSMVDPAFALLGLGLVIATAL